MNDAQEEPEAAGGTNLVEDSDSFYSEAEGKGGCRCLEME